MRGEVAERDSGLQRGRRGRGRKRSAAAAADALDDDRARRRRRRQSDGRSLPGEDSKGAAAGDLAALPELELRAEDLGLAGDELFFWWKEVEREGERRMRRLRKKSKRSKAANDFERSSFAFCSSSTPATYRDDDRVARSRLDAELVLLVIFGVYRGKHREKIKVRIDWAIGRRRRRSSRSVLLPLFSLLLTGSSSNSLTLTSTGCCC